MTQSSFEKLAPAKHTSTRGVQSLSVIAMDLFLELDKIGVSNLSDDDCCRLLAWLHYDRGCSEEPVHNWALGRDIKIAQQRLNIYGGEIPNDKLLGRFQGFCRELEQPDKKPEWFIEIVRKYKLV